MRSKLTSVTTFALILAAAGFGVTASATPARPDAATTSDARAASDPSSLIDPTTPLTQDGTVLPVGVGARATKLKINIALPSTYVFAYPFDQRVPLTRRPVPAIYLPARPDPSCVYTFDGGISATLWAVKIDDKRNKIVSVGNFGDVRVSTLAFGAVPVTATLRLRQLVRNGRAEPLRLLAPSGGFASIEKSDPAGIKNGEKGCDPAWEKNSSGSQGVATGRLSVEVEDVTVDGRPLDVGRTCRTRTPLDLYLNGQDQEHGGTGYSSLEGGMLRQQLVRTHSGGANPVPFFPGSRNLIIPRFVGCMSRSGEDVSPLISGLVSGPNNTIAVAQGAINFNVVPQPTKENPVLCDPTGECIRPLFTEPIRPPVPGR